MNESGNQSEQHVNPPQDTVKKTAESVYSRDIPNVTNRYAQTERLKQLAQADRQTSTRKAEQKLEELESEARRKEFSGEVIKLFDDAFLWQEYIKDVVCQGDPELYKTYPGRVKSYKENYDKQNWWGKFYTKMTVKNPEVNVELQGVEKRSFQIAKILETYYKHYFKNNEQMRVLYPAAGKDESGLLKYSNLLKKYNIKYIFVDPVHASSASPETHILPILKNFTDENHIENHKMGFDQYIKSQSEIYADVYLYDTFISNNPRAGSGYLAFGGIKNTELLDKVFLKDSLIIGNSSLYSESIRQMNRYASTENQVLEQTLEYLSKKFRFIKEKSTRASGNENGGDVSISIKK